ncbi:FAD/NAD(P)-binding protein [Actinacidiphila yeochonensis]|uniref:FAD/NAD(P)-binding protein n=1 Tax=Actinacidiphila yeochonensis TaxID=89050 RepID=UPI00056C28DD|nr:FAD/NAD(P)-binding protein [Actinacidiphila yeochonensis]
MPDTPTAAADTAERAVVAPDTAERVVVVVGAGFRGTSVLERLAANVGRFRPAGGRLHVVAVDEYPSGPGRIWRTDQSSELLMNTPAAAFTVWLDESVDAEGPAVAGPSLWEWQRRLAALLAADAPGSTGPAAGPPPADGGVLSGELAADLVRRPELAAFLREATAHSYTPRVLLGHYLRWCHTSVVASLPPGTRYTETADRVTDIAAAGDRYQVVLAGGGAPLLADSIVLCTGWSTPARSTPPPAGRVSAPRGAVHRLRGDNAADQSLAEAKPGADVVVEGLGLSFFDVTTLLTVGRGGRFRPDRAAAHGLRYEPSGTEPVLHATSRVGVPYWSRPSAALPDGDSGHRFLREALRCRPRPGRFEESLGPAVLRDTFWDYYTHLAATDPGALAVPLRRLLDTLASVPPDGARWRETVAEAVPVPANRLELDGDRALADRVWDDAARFGDAVRARVLADLAETAKGAGSSVRTAHRSLGRARALLVAAVQDGGLDAESYFGGYADFVDLAFRLNNGPPPVRLRQLLALVDAGVVRFLGPRAAPVPVESPDVSGGVSGTEGVPWRSPAVPGPGVRAHLVIEARVPQPSLHGGSDPLLRALRRRGLADVFSLRSAHGPVPTAAPRAEPSTGRLLGPEGLNGPAAEDGSAGVDGRRPASRLYALGVLMRDARVSSLAAPAPRANAAALGEADRTARSVLAELWASPA